MKTARLMTLRIQDPAIRTVVRHANSILETAKGSVPSEDNSDIRAVLHGASNKRCSCFLI